jgi:hypothetical protein
MAAIDLEIAEARRRLPQEEAKVEIDRLTNQLKKLEAELLG